MHPSHQQFLLYSTLIWFFILTARNSIISLIYSPSLLHYEIYWTFQSHTLELTPKVTTCHTLPDASPYKFKPAVQFNSPSLKCILNSSTSLHFNTITKTPSDATWAKMNSAVQFSIRLLCIFRTYYWYYSKPEMQFSVSFSTSSIHTAVSSESTFFGFNSSFTCNIFCNFYLNLYYNC